MPDGSHPPLGGSASIGEAELRIKLVEACRSLQANGLVRGTCGNVGLRVDDGFLISPSGVPYGSLTPEIVVRVEWDGRHQGLRPSTEWRMHRDLFLARPELNAIVHTHSTHATAVAVLNRDIPALHYSIAAAGGISIRCAPYATYGTQELADSVVKTMVERNACLLAHHGAVAAHADLAGALSLAYIVEELARLYLLCLPIGTPPLLSDHDIAAVRERNRSYGQWDDPARPATVPAIADRK